MSYITDIENTFLVLTQSINFKHGSIYILYEAKLEGNDRISRPMKPTSYEKNPGNYFEFENIWSVDKSADELIVYCLVPRRWQSWNF